MTVPDLPTAASASPARETPPTPVAQASPAEASQVPEAASAETADPAPEATAVPEDASDFELPDAADLPPVDFPVPNLTDSPVRVPAAPVNRPPLEPFDGTATGSAADLGLPSASLTMPPTTSNQEATVSVPAPPPTPTRRNATPAVTASDPESTSVPFGEPLPNAQATAPIDPQVWLPANTQLALQYPRQEKLELDSDMTWQEVLLLSQDVQDQRTGAVILPAGTQVIGRFETGRYGSRFVAQAISLQGRNVKLTAESDVLTGTRDVSEDALLRNSGIGAAAATVVSGFSGVGLLAGAAAGVAATYVTAPQPAVIYPYQTIQVRVLEDVPRSQISPVSQL